MKQIFPVLFGLLLSVQAGAQPIRKKMPVKPALPVTSVQIPETATTSPAAMATWLKTHTGSSTALQQALYSWMAGNIVFDVARMNEISNYRDTAAAIQQTLHTRKGLSTDFAVLYARVCREAGINAVVVTGYTLQGDGMVPLGTHDWVAVKSGTQWTVTDPAWGAGTLENGRFVQHTDWKWFQMVPQVAVKTHMPFDPLWQLIPFPLRHDELGSRGFAAAAKRPVFSYADSLVAWSRQSRLERLQHAAARITQFGGAVNPFIMNELDWMQQSIRVLASNQEIEMGNRQIDQFNEVNRDYTEIAKLYNEYVTFRNRGFQPEIKDQVLRKMIDEIAGRLTGAEKTLLGLEGSREPVRQHVDELLGVIRNMKEKVGGEQAFVSKYIKTVKAKRKDLFDEKS